MAPTRMLTSPASPAFLRRFSTLLLSSTLVLLVAGTALASMGGDRPFMVGDSAGQGWGPGELPDVAVLVEGIDPRDPIIERQLVPALAEIRGVDVIVTEPAAGSSVAVYASLLDGTDATVLGEVEHALAAVVPDATVSVGGRAVADRDLLDRLNRGTVVAVLPVLILLTVLVMASYGLKLGLATGGSVGAATLLGGLVGSQLAGSFDGSLGTTALPAVLVAILISTVLSFRLLDWFKRPEGEDPAAVIRNSIRYLLPEVGLLFAGLIVTALVLAVAGPGTTPVTVVAVGAIFGSMVTFAVLPPVLASLPVVPDEDDYRLFHLQLPDGRDFPTAILAGFVFFLLALGLFAVRVPSNELLDESSLPAGVTSRRVSEQLVALGGDPTSAILATMNSDVTPAKAASWAQSASLLPAVGWTETLTGRFIDGERVSAPFDADSYQDSTGVLAVVTPAVTARSGPAQDLVGQLDALEVESVNVNLSGVPVDARDTAGDASGHLWLLVCCIAVAGGVAVLILVGDLRTAFVAVVLRLIGTLSLLGIYGLVVEEASGVELQTAALIVAVGVGLFELGFLRTLAKSRPVLTADVIDDLLAPPLAADPISEALRREGRAAMLGLGVTALCGLGLLASDLEVARRLGIAVAVGVVVELLVGTWLLRPVLLGRRVISVPSERRGRISLEPAPAAGISLDDDVELDPEWRRVVSGLLRAEFNFQNDPVNAELSTVFVEDTPVFGELAEHNRRLREAKFRVIGKGPELLKVQAVNTGSPVTLAITVNHPERRLIDRDSNVLGVRKPERRDGMLWLTQDPSGRYRIAEAVDLGTGDLDVSTHVQGAAVTLV